MMEFGKKEKESVRILYSDLGDDKLQSRVESCLNWYIEAASKYKFGFYLFSLISIIMPLFVTVLNNFCTGTETASCFIRNAITVCSVLATLVASILTFFKLQEKWLLYRTTAEEIKRELSLYLAGKTGDKDIENLMFTIEEHMSQERKEWVVLSRDSNKDTDADAGKGSGRNAGQESGKDMEK